MITLEHITARYREEVVLRDLALHVARGEMVALTGPNGAGKSTLLRVVTGLLPADGRVRVAGADIRKLGARDRARLLSVVPQDIASDIPFTAHDFVLLGRTASMPRLSGPSREDRQAVQDAMTLTDTWHLRQRPLPEMSGGERQRLALAMALATRPKIILLDEPTSHLDLRHRAEMMRLLTALNREQQTTILMVVHDLTLASQFFSRIVLLSDGRVLADGAVADVMRPDLLEAAYACPVSVIPLPGTAAACILPRL